MVQVSKDTFEKVISTMECDPDTESDADFDYKIYVTPDGETIGAITIEGDQFTDYSLFGAAAQMVGDAVNA